MLFCVFCFLFLVFVSKGWSRGASTGIRETSLDSITLPENEASLSHVSLPQRLVDSAIRSCGIPARWLPYMVTREFFSSSSWSHYTYRSSSSVQLPKPRVRHTRRRTELLAVKVVLKCSLLASAAVAWLLKKSVVLPSKEGCELSLGRFCFMSRSGEERSASEKRLLLSPALFVVLHHWPEFHGAATSTNGRCVACVATEVKTCLFVLCNIRYTVSSGRREELPF